MLFQKVMKNYLILVWVSYFSTEFKYMSTRFFLSFISLLIMAESSLAQFNPDSTKIDYCVICSNHTHETTSPYYHSFNKELPFLITTGATVASAFIVSGLNKTKPFTQEQLNTLDPNAVNSFDRKSINNWDPNIAKTSDIVLAGVTVLPILFISEHHTRHDIKSLLVMSAEVFGITFGITNTVKNVNRTRPYVYNTDLPLSERTASTSRESFFSGHTSHTAAATFFFAKVISDYHPNLKPGVKAGVWAFAISVPAVEGYFRIKAGKHFPTDVITGYIVGASTGFLIPHWHKKPDHRFDVGFAPYEDGMQFSLNFRL